MSNTRPSICAPARDAGATLLALFSLVFFLRLWLVREWGSPLPFWDQWDAEAAQLYRPWLDGTFHWADLFRAHNEHHIVLTRLVDLALFVLTGHWETWWQLVINAALNAVTATVLVRVFWNSLPAHSARIAFLLTTVALFTTPSGWQNALWGFQSQCYLVNGLSCLAAIGLVTSDPICARWWGGWAAALLALVAQASGVFAALAALVLHTLRVATAKFRSGDDSFALALLATPALLGLGLWTGVPGHAYLRAGSVAEFFAVFTRCLAWPHIDQPLAAIALQAPLIWLVYDLLRRRRFPSPAEGCALTLGFISLLNAAGIAFSRGAGLVDHLPISRYHEGLILGAVGNLFALLSLAARWRRGPLVATGWIALLVLGLGVLATGSLTFNLPFKAEQDRTSSAMIAAYLETHDPAVFQQAPPFLRPHPDPRSVIAILDDPVLLQVLPPELRGAPGHRPSPIEYAPWLAAVSAVALASCLVRRTPSARKCTIDKTTLT